MKTIIINTLLLGSLGSFALNYEVRDFSERAHAMMHDRGKNALYIIPMEHVSQYLPEEQTIKHRGIKLLASRIIPGKSILRLALYGMLMHQYQQKSSSPEELFGNLQEGIPHTYVVLDDKIIFTESTSLPMIEKYRDKFSKHYMISGLASTVRYAGEFYVYKNMLNQEIFVVFDNSSGTFKPESKYLKKLERLLALNLGSNQSRIYFVSKSFEQKTDQEKLFAHSETPF